MELEGSLKAFSLPEILQFLSIGKMTGTLSVQSESRTINLMIRKGRIVNSSSFTTGRRLGSMLVHHGLINRRQLEEALAHKRNSNERRLLGQILLDEKYITHDALYQHIKMQLQEEVWDLFRLSEGDFKFEHGEPTEMKDIQIEIEIEPLIIEGTRQLDEWHRVLKNIPGDEYVVRLTKVDDNFEPIPLTTEEWKVLSYINGKLTIGAIVAKSTVGKFETYNNLNTFLSAGMIELRPELEASQGGRDQNLAEFVIPMGGGVPVKLEEAKDGGSPNLINRYFDDPRQRKEFEGKMVFMSPIGLLAHFANMMVERLWGHGDFVPAPEDSVFVEKRWNAMINEYFTADGISVVGNFVNASALEKFIGYYGGVAVSLRTAYADSLQALGELTRAITNFAHERLGKRHGAALRDELIEKFNTQSVVRFEDAEFDLKRRIVASGS